MTSGPTQWTCACGVQVPMGCSHSCNLFELSAGQSIEPWVLYEAAARGIAKGRLGRRFRDSSPEGRQPTSTERMWAKLAVDAVLAYVEIRS